MDILRIKNIKLLSIHYFDVVGPEVGATIEGFLTSAGFKLVSQGLQKSAVYTYTVGASIPCGLVSWDSVSHSSTWIQTQSALDVVRPSYAWPVEIGTN